MPEHETEDVPLEPDENDDETLDDADADLQPPNTDNADKPASMSEAEIEKAMKALDKESTRHANRISEIMGADAQELEPCPLCIPNMTGFVFPSEIPDDQREAVLALLTGTTSGEYKEDPDANTCDVCDGAGVTTTGSKVLEHLRRPCPACIGMGYLTSTTRAQWEGSQALRNPPAPPTPIATAWTPQTDGRPATDAWGRPSSHWLYGRDPRYLTESERASDLPTVQAV